MTRVLMFIGHYLPARHFGGPVRSTVSMVESLPEVEFHVFTSDTDFKSPEVLDGIQPDRWQGRGRAQVFYASARNRTPWVISCSVRQVLAPGALGLKRGSDTVLRWLRPLGQREAI